MKQISILGCGWLGFALAQLLIKHNYAVIGSSTSEEKIKVLNKQNISTYLINLPDSIHNLKHLLQTETLIITTPFKRHYAPSSLYLDNIKLLVKEIKRYNQVKHVIFTSSTSIYPNSNSIVTEDDIITPTTDRQQTLYDIEQLLLHESSFDTIITRLSGLYGPNRDIGKFIQQKTDQNGENKVNLIHQDDACLILLKLIQSSHWNTVYNLVSDDHPTKKSLYSKKAKDNNMIAPQFNSSSPLAFKIVSNNKIKTMLNYNFIHPTPLT